MVVSVPVTGTLSEDCCGLKGNCGTAVSVGPDLNPSRSALDTKNYRQIVLSNGLRCLLIEDVPAYGQCGQELDEADDSACSNDNNSEDSENSGEDEEDFEDGKKCTSSGQRDAAVCVMVRTGSAYDPVSCQGLAHFLEHLLFMGSDKYPSENEFDNFVSKHGGYTNAWTEWEYTGYTLSIPQAHLFQATDRLAQFFIAPLLSPDAVERERQSIESEFQLHKNSDSVRWTQLISAMAPTSHFLSRFAWGNLRTLRDIPAQLNVDPMKELWKFYHAYYYAANMRLVIVGAYSLDMLQDKVNEIFGAVPKFPCDRVGSSSFGCFDPMTSQSLPIEPRVLFSWTNDYVYTPAVAKFGDPLGRSVGKLFRIVPVKNAHIISLTWSLPPQTIYWRSKPGDFVAHLLGHEGRGSLLSYLRQKSWVTTVEVGCGGDGLEDASSHTLFTARFTLSESGMKLHWKEVIDAIYSCFGLLKHYSVSGWPSWLYDELRDTSLLAYRYQDEPSSDDLVEQLGEAMCPHYQLPFDRILDGDALYFDFDSAAVQALLVDRLTPEKARIDLTSCIFGRSVDYDDGAIFDGTETVLREWEELEDIVEVPLLRPSTLPNIEYMFGTRFWCNTIPPSWINEWTSMSSGIELHTLPLSLPLPNPYIPTKLDLKSLPIDDDHHPLLHCSLKLCIEIKKTKQWFPATPIRYSRAKHSLLMLYEDDHEVWHQLDIPFEFHFVNGININNSEGTFDNKTIRFRILSTNRNIKIYGDASDSANEDGSAFPNLPPALPPSRLPTEISSSNLLKFWWLQDRTFRRPIADLRLQFNCGLANKSPLHRTVAELLKLLVVDALVEDSYMASLCDSTYGLFATDTGFYVSVSGFDHKLIDLFEQVISTFLSFADQSGGLPPATSKKRFAVCVEILQRKYKNSNIKSTELCSSIRLHALRRTNWSVQDKLKELATLDISTFSRVSSSLLGEFAIEGLYHGNINRSDAEITKALILSLLERSPKVSLVGLPRKKYPAQSVVQFPQVSTTGKSSKYMPILRVPSKDPSDLNTSVEVYVQISKDNTRNRVLVDLLVQMIRETFFDQVRTKDQFGYNCWCDSRWSFGVIGIVFHVTTNVKSADSVVERIDQFLSEYQTELESMSQSDFSSHVTALATQKLDMFDSLGAETASYWEEIRDGRFDWQCWRTEVLELSRITHLDVYEAYRQWLAPAARRRIVAIQVIGRREASEGIYSDRPRLTLTRNDGENESSYGNIMNEQISSFHAVCKGQVWGRINSKLF